MRRLWETPEAADQWDVGQTITGEGWLYLGVVLDQLEPGGSGLGDAE